MAKYILIVAYDGTEYAGWQMQPGHTTVEGVLRATFITIFNKDVTLLAASRTDAGVHARANTVRLEADISIPPDRLMYALNNKLPATVVIEKAYEGNEFHPFYKVDYKEYHYTLFFQRPSPLYARYGWFVPQPLDEKKLEEVLHLYKGTHDFSQFTSTDDSRTDKVRTITDAYITQESPWRTDYCRTIVIVGKKFLHTMVRRMVGTAVYVAMHPHAFQSVVKDMLDKGIETDYRLNAPARGLVLHAIKYHIRNKL